MLLHGTPKYLRCGNSGEFTAKKVRAGAAKAEMNTVDVPSGSSCETVIMIAHVMIHKTSEMEEQYYEMENKQNPWDLGQWTETMPIASAECMSGVQYVFVNSVCHGGCHP